MLKGKGLGFSVNAAIGSDVEQRIVQRKIDTEIEDRVQLRIGQGKRLNSHSLVDAVEKESSDIGFGDKSFWNNSFGENAFKGL